MKGILQWVATALIGAAGAVLSQVLANRNAREALETEIERYCSEQGSFGEEA